MSAPSLRDAPAGLPAWGDAAQAMYRAAQAVSRPGGAATFALLMHELADILDIATTFVAVFTDESRSELRTLAAVLDGKPMRSFDYALEGSPCARVVGHAYRHVASGVAAEFKPHTLFAAKGMDSYAAFPLFDIRIGRLRRKVEPDPAGEPRCIRTVRNAGYMYVPG